VLESASRGPADRSLAAAVDLTAAAIAATMGPVAHDDGAARAGAAFAALAALEGALGLGMPPSPRPSPRNGGPPPAAGDPNFRARFVDTLRERTNVAEFLTIHECHPNEGSCWMFAVWFAGFLFRCLAGSVGAGAGATDAVHADFEYTCNVSAVAPTLRDACRELVLHNAPSRIAGASARVHADRAAMVASARASGALVADWLAPCYVAFSDVNFAVLQYVAHDPISNVTYSVRVIRLLDRVGKPASDGGARWSPL